MMRLASRCSLSACRRLLDQKALQWLLKGEDKAQEQKGHEEYDHPDRTVSIYVVRTWEGPEL